MEQPVLKGCFVFLFLYVVLFCLVVYTADYEKIESNLAERSGIFMRLLHFGDHGFILFGLKLFSVHFGRDSF